MSWWPTLVSDLLEAVRNKPFESRALIVPSAFARRSLRVRLAQALAEHGLPLSGLQMLTPNQLHELYPIRGLIRSQQQVRLALLDAFAANPSLLGGRGHGAWRDQLTLALNLLGEDLESVDPQALATHFPANSRLLRFMQTIRSVVADLPGDSALAAAEASQPPRLSCWTLPLPPMPQRVQKLLDDLSPVHLQSPKASNALWLRARSVEALVEATAQSITELGGQRLAIVILDPSLRGPLERCLTQKGLLWTGPTKVGLGLDPDQRWLSAQPMADSSDVASLADWASQLDSGASQRVSDAVSELVSSANSKISGGAFVDQLARSLGRYRPQLGWPQASLHLVPASSWPDCAYDHVVLLGPKRGSLAEALNDQTRLLRPSDRSALRTLGLNSFDPSQARQRQKLWLQAWQEAADHLSVGWVTHDGSGRTLAVERWAARLTKDCQAKTAPQQTLNRDVAPPVSACFWPKQNRSVWYPSQVEGTLRCARRELLSRLLKLDARSVESELERYSSPLWVGNRLHAIAQQACQAIANGDAPLSELEQRLKQATQDELNAYQPAISPSLLPVLESSLFLRFRALIERFQSGQFRRILGVEETVPAQPQPGDMAARCDLIIEDDHGRRIMVDLKSGTAKTAATLAKDEAKGKSLQRGAYLACERAADLAGMLYLGSGAQPFVAVDREGQQQAWAAEALQRAQQQLDSGAFPLRPGRPERECKGCEMRAACRTYDLDWRQKLDQAAPQFDLSIKDAVAGEDPS